MYKLACLYDDTATFCNINMFINHFMQDSFDHGPSCLRGMLRYFEIKILNSQQHARVVKIDNRRVMSLDDLPDEFLGRRKVLPKDGVKLILTMDKIWFTVPS